MPAIAFLKSSSPDAQCVAVPPGAPVHSRQVHVGLPPKDLTDDGPFTVGFRFGNRLRTQRLKAPFYTLKSATKVPNLIDFARFSGDS
jgi:hypothetical protein